MIRYEEGSAIPLAQILALYKALGWRQHLHPERVARALAASSGRGWGPN